MERVIAANPQNGSKSKDDDVDDDESETEQQAPSTSGAAEEAKEEAPNQADSEAPNTAQQSVTQEEPAIAEKASTTSLTKELPGTPDRLPYGDFQEEKNGFLRSLDVICLLSQVRLSTAIRDCRSVVMHLCLSIPDTFLWLCQAHVDLHNLY